jgi:hypothetical protein
LFDEFMGRGLSKDEQEVSDASVSNPSFLNLRDVPRRTRDQYQGRSGPPDVRIRGFIMQDNCFIRTRPPGGGFVTIGTLIVAAASALMLVLMAGCHARPGANGFVSTAADKAAEARLHQPDTMPPLQPFDEQFAVTPPESN